MIPIQYQNSPAIMALAEFACANFSTRHTIDAFFDMVVNIDTARGFGLDIWGRIVGASRSIHIPGIDNDYFGFAGTPQKPFNQAVFYSGDAHGNRYFMLSDDAFRTVILLKAMLNISDMSCMDINRILSTIFPGRGACWCVDLGNMEIELRFTFALEAWEYAILTNSLYQPKPAGVRIRGITQFDPGSVLMFSETGATNPFGSVPFFSSGEHL